MLRGPRARSTQEHHRRRHQFHHSQSVGFDREADIKVGVGNYNRREVEGDLQTALVPDRLAVRFAFTYTKVDGYIQNVLPGHPDLEGVDQYGMRLSFLYKANDDLNFTLRLSKSMQDPQNYAIIDGRISPAFAGQSRRSRIQGILPHPGRQLRRRGRWTNYQIAQNYTPRRRQDNEAVELTGEWTVSPTNKVTSITSWDEGRAVQSGRHGWIAVRRLEDSLHRRYAPGDSGSASDATGDSPAALHRRGLLPARDRVQFHQNEIFTEPGVQHLQRLSRLCRKYIRRR